MTSSARRSSRERWSARYACRARSCAWRRAAGAAGLREETARRVDEEIRTLVMRGYETARQIIERQRPAGKALAEELLRGGTGGADRLREILAVAVLPASTFPTAVRDALMQARLGS